MFKASYPYKWDQLGEHKTPNVVYEYCLDYFKFNLNEYINWGVQNIT
jgi:hypothetical protein